jgi:hypothetical protein
MFREAISYPTRPPDGGRSVIVGGLLLVVATVLAATAALGPPWGYLAALAVLPWLLVRGYHVRIVRTTIGRNHPTPPRFDDVPRLLRDGLIAVAVSIAYLAPGGIVLGPLLAIRASGTDLSTLLSELAVPAFVSTPLVSVAGVLAVLAVMYVLGALYVIPIAIARYAHSGRPRAAFGFGTVVAGSVTEDYIIAWAVSVVLQVFLLPVAYLLGVLVVGFFLHFIVSAGVRYCHGRGVGAALDLDPVPASHERSDPDEWDLPPAVRRIERSDRSRGEPANQARSEVVQSAVRRVEEDTGRDGDRPRR